MVCDRKVCSPLDCATEDHIVEDGVLLSPGVKFQRKNADTTGNHTRFVCRTSEK